MSTNHDELKILGWNDWFEKQAAGKPTMAIARVAAVDREQLLLVDPAGVVRAKLSGNFLHRHSLAHERPCVGDWVCLEREPGDDFGMIHALFERRTALRRRAAGPGSDFQMIAANIDCAIIVQSCHYDFNLNRLERYLVMVMDGGAVPHILLTKTDLVAPDVLAGQLASIRAAGITAPVSTLSNMTGDGLEPLEQRLESGKTYCFVGSSGVGKSTLINHLVGRGRQETKAVSGTGEGRHTTVRRELIRLDGGALVIDNPGMREFGVCGAENGIESGYSDIASLSAGCRYRNCTHTGEPGCAVREAVQSGNLSSEHFDNYRKLRHESEFHQLSHAEKRKKDRDFGKFLKNAKKSFRDK